MRKRTRNILILVAAGALILSIPAGYFAYQKSLRGFVSKNPFKPENIVYIDPNGTQLFGPQIIDGVDYYLVDETGIVHKGFKETEVGTYYYDKDGKKVIGLTTIDDATYLFEDTGIMVKNEYRDVTVNDRIQLSYFKEDGEMAIGPTDINGKKIMFTETGELQIDFEGLRDGVQEIISKYGGNVEAYYKDLTTNTSFNINPDTMMYPCCMVKPFALAKIYEQIDQCILSYDEHAFYIENMIIVSDNTSYNKMMKAVGNGDGVNGVAQVNEFC